MDRCPIEDEILILCYSPVNWSSYIKGDSILHVMWYNVMINTLLGTFLDKLSHLKASS